MRNSKYRRCYIYIYIDVIYKLYIYIYSTDYIAMHYIAMHYIAIMKYIVA